MNEQSPTTHSRAAIERHLAEQLPHWGYDGAFLCRTYRTGGWRATTMAFGAIAHLAEVAWHHPDIQASYASLEVRLQTHDAGGITDKDFELAARIEDVVAWRPKGGALDGLPDEDRFRYVLPDERGPA